MNPLFEKRAVPFGPLLFMLLSALFVLMPEAIGQSTDDGNQFDIQRPALGSYTVVALRVEFQPDSSRFSTGDGTFSDSLYKGLDVSIDPLPHDDAYFDAHLRFLENYVDAASGGRASVESILVPGVWRMSRQMAHYSPIGPDSDNKLGGLAHLVEEAWTSAESVVADIVAPLDPTRTFLILFHAGAGRDIELVGSGINLDKTPEDLPSLFLDSATLERFLLQRPVSIGDFPVTHTAILPEAESRLGSDPISDDPFVLELSINGLLVASFFNFLGVPDLFDTGTGESAIGPFGLMDPLGIFAYSGLLPPIPSPWTRQYLGWIDPVVIQPGEPETVSVRAHSGSIPGQVVRVPISSDEYFLVENRQRDPSADGIRLDVYRDGLLESVSLPLGDDSFTDRDQSGFPGGVLVNVDHFDWSLPGTADEDGKRYDGGILIWHIDDGVIRSGGTYNTINNDKNRRGIDVEEADGGQDLGNPPNNPFAARLDLGTPFDFWFEDNPASAISETGRVTSLYQNRFAGDTKPSSASNGGGDSFVEIGGFTASGPTMGFVVSRSVGDDTGVLLAYEDDLLDGEKFNGHMVLKSFVDGVAYPGVAFGCRVDMSRTTGGVLKFLGGEQPPIEGIGCAEPVTLRNGGVAYVRYEAQNGQGWKLTFQSGPDVAPELEVELPEELFDAIPASPLVLVEEGVSEAIYIHFRSDADDRIVRVETSGATAIVAAGESGKWLGLAAPDGGPLYAFDADGGGEIGSPHKWTWSLSDSLGSLPVVVGIDRDGLIAVAGTRHGQLIVSRENEPLPTVFSVPAFSDVYTENVASGDIGLADLDNDGLLDIFGAAGIKVWAYTTTGAVVSGFPVTMPQFVSGSPIAVRHADDERTTLIVATTDGIVRSIGEGSISMNTVAGDRETGALLASESSLFAFGATGAIRAWSLKEGTVPIWGERFGNRRNGSAVTSIADISPETGEAVFDAAETYAWPNPARSEASHIRFRTRSACTVGIRIVDLAGSLVGHFDERNVSGGAVNEIRWTHDLSSGVYYSRLKATCEDGRTEDHVVKIGVVR